MMNELVKSTKESASWLSKIRQIPMQQLRPESSLPFLRQAINCKLMIQEEQEDQIKNLVILSIREQDRKAGHLPDGVLKAQIRKYDCHQVSLMAQKKTLLFMFIEKELGITLEDDEAVAIETLEQLAAAVTRHLKEGL